MLATWLLLTIKVDPLEPTSIETRNIVSEKAAIKEFDRINNECRENNENSEEVYNCDEFSTDIYRETRYTYEDGREIIFILEKLVYI